MPGHFWIALYMNSQVSRGWATTCWGLLGEPVKILTSVFCPPIAYFSASEAFETEPAGVCESLLGGYCCCIGYRLRTRLREARQLHGSKTTDFCAHCLCHCAALARVWQEAQEDPFNSWNMQCDRLGNRFTSGQGQTNPIVVSSDTPIGVAKQEMPTDQIMARDPVWEPAGEGGSGASIATGRMSPEEMFHGQWGTVPASQDRTWVPSACPGEGAELVVGLNPGDVVEKYRRILLEQSGEKEMLETLKHMTIGTPVGGRKDADERARQVQKIRRELEKYKPETSRDNPVTGVHSIEKRLDQDVQRASYELAQAEMEGSLGNKYAIETCNPLGKRTVTDLRSSLANGVDYILSTRDKSPSRVIKTMPVTPTSTTEKG